MTRRDLMTTTGLRPEDTPEPVIGVWSPSTAPGSRWSDGQCSCAVCCVRRFEVSIRAAEASFWYGDSFAAVSVGWDGEVTHMVRDADDWFHLPPMDAGSLRRAMGRAMDRAIIDGDSRFEPREFTGLVPQPLPVDGRSSIWITRWA